MGKEKTAIRVLLFPTLILVLALLRHVEDILRVYPRSSDRSIISAEEGRGINTQTKKRVIY